MKSHTITYLGPADALIIDDIKISRGHPHTMPLSEDQVRTLRGMKRHTIKVEPVEPLFIDEEEAD